MDSTIQILITIIGSGAVMSFIQFLIQRHDNKNDKTKELEEKLNKGLEEREATGKERYDKHAKDIEELRDIMKQLAKTTKEQQEYSEAVGKVLMGLAHDKIVHLGKIYQRRGAITLAEQNNLKMLYVPYHEGLEGNSDGEGYYEYCMHLPVITDEEAQKLDKANKEELMRQITA